MSVDLTPLPQMVSPVCVSVQDLHVRYRLRSERSTSVRDLLSPSNWTRSYEEIHAVRGVSFDVHDGEVVGIIGANGCGKSTLLRSIAGLQPAASGRVLVTSMPALLGVGATLKPDLSGRRNIVIGGLALGLDLRSAQALIPEAIEFSELGDAIDRPMRTYSSGMRARLAFAIATLSKPEILLIDEALAVGDRHFRRKSLAKIREMQTSAKAIIMVTHNLNEIRSTCSRALWIDAGTIRADGTVDAILDEYESMADDPSSRSRGAADQAQRPRRRRRQVQR